MEIDLKETETSWGSALETFCQTQPKKISDILSSIQYYYNCKLSVDQTNTDMNSKDNHEETSVRQEFQEDRDDEDDFDDDNYPIVSHEHLKELEDAEIPLREHLHAKLAADAGMIGKVFENDSNLWTVDPNEPHGTPITEQQIDALKQWKHSMAITVQNVNNQQSGAESSASDRPGDVSHIVENDEAQFTDSETAETALSPVTPCDLTAEQKRAYDIVRWHVLETLAGQNPAPFRMRLEGEGGTGKSRVIQSISQFFRQQGIESSLQKMAYTGIAASLIEGKTIHSALMLNEATERISDEKKQKLQAHWATIRYVIIDEDSMLSKRFLATISKVLTMAKGTENAEGPGRSFGGLSIILAGDFHQFPPVVAGKRDALFYPNLVSSESEERVVGRLLFEEFRTAVQLTQQMRVTDEGWQVFLRRMCYGEVTDEDIKSLNSLILSNRQNHPIDFTIPPWRDCALITPRHAVRMEWNNHAIRKHCSEARRILYICKAEDTIKGEPLSLAQQIAVAERNIRSKRTHKNRADLPRVVEIAIGMRVMVT